MAISPNWLWKRPVASGPHQAMRFGLAASVFEKQALGGSEKASSFIVTFRLAKPDQGLKHVAYIGDGLVR